MDALEYTCDVCGKPIATEKGLKIHLTRMHAQDGEASRIAPEEPLGPYDLDTGEIRPVSQDDETGPIEAPKLTWREKMWGKSSPAPKPATTLERSPRKRRASTEGIWSTTWTAAGVALQRTGADIPVGRVMQFQAPVVGGVLDEAIAGTFIDTLLQPIAGSGKKFKKVSAVVSLPVLVGIIERSPQTAPMLEPILREVLREHLVALAQQAKKVHKQEAEYRKAMEDLGMTPGDDPIDALMADIFGPMAGQPEHNGAGVKVDA